MLFTMQIAASEQEALDASQEYLRLPSEHLIITETNDVEDGTEYRVEANKSRGQEAHDIMAKLMDGLGIDGELFFIDSYDAVTINITGDNLGLLIGKNGATLEAVETLVSAMHNNKYRYYKPIVINPGGYLENKNRYLSSLVDNAIAIAGKDKEVSLQPMDRRDRKLVHQMVNEHEGFKSKSLGDGIDRRVVIFMGGPDDEPKGNATPLRDSRPQERKPRRDDRSRRDNRGRGTDDRDRDRSKAPEPSSQPQDKPSYKDDDDGTSGYYEQDF